MLSEEFLQIEDTARIFNKTTIFQTRYSEQSVGSVVEWQSAGLVTNTVSVQNLLAPFCCVLGKDTLRHFPLLGGPGKQF